MEYNVLLGAEAGQGANTIETIFSKTLLRMGYNIFSNKDYMSRVRGGHNFDQIRFSKSKVHTHSDKLDIIAAFSKETVELHKNRLKPNGLIICSSKFNITGENIIAFPFEELSKEFGNPKAMNMIILGIIFKLFDIPMEIAKEVLRENTSEKFIESNLNALRQGRKMVEVKYRLMEKNNENMLINGNKAIALGALAAGCTFYSAYPMAPSTGIMNYMAEKQEVMGIVVEQAEDEISAINMVVGASFGGARAMTATSGGGYCLMAETIGFLGVSETPAVIVNVQRPGPATGLPTRTAQADLKFAVNISQDEFPKMIIAPRDAADAFYQTIRAFDIAEKYQIPVTILSDQYLADASKTVKVFDFENIKIDRHIETHYSDDKYKRHEYTETGISPRIIPGKSGDQVYILDSHEHDEYGHIVEDKATRIKMMQKRMNKIEALKVELQEPWVIGKENSDILLISWGSSYGAIKETVEKFNEEGVFVTALVFGDMWPLPKNLLEKYIPKAKKIISIECNYSGQLADIIQEQLCFKIENRINRYDGRTWSIEELYDELREVIYE
ncbi:MAG: 2-oxoacid:acceptor oxidoreductase subunit alpha [Proteocatella sp.]